MFSKTFLILVYPENVNKDVILILCLSLRIVWRGGMGLAEKMAVGLQKVPMLVSAALICAVPLSCGAASLAAGATFYMFIVRYIWVINIYINLCRLKSGEFEIRNKTSYRNKLVKCKFLCMCDEYTSFRCGWKWYE